MSTNAHKNKITDYRRAAVRDLTDEEVNKKKVTKNVDKGTKKQEKWLKMSANVHKNKKND